MFKLKFNRYTHTKVLWYLRNKSLWKPLSLHKGKGLLRVIKSLPWPLPSWPLPWNPGGLPNPCTSLYFYIYHHSPSGSESSIEPFSCIPSHRVSTTQILSGTQQLGPCSLASFRSPAGDLPPLLWPWINQSVALHVSWHLSVAGEITLSLPAPWDNLPIIDLKWRPSCKARSIYEFFFLKKSVTN